MSRQLDRSLQVSHTFFLMMIECNVMYIQSGLDFTDLNLLAYSI